MSTAPKPSEILKGLTKEEVLRAVDAVAGAIIWPSERARLRADLWSAVAKVLQEREQVLWRAYEAASTKRSVAFEAFGRRKSKRAQDAFQDARMEADRHYRAWQDACALLRRKLDEQLNILRAESAEADHESA